MTPIEKALKTWYQPDNLKYRDPLHPTIKLAGEIGELLDLYAKHLFKPNFNWNKCKSCKDRDPTHFNHLQVSFVLDELGDIWYYLRILAWMNNITLKLPNEQQNHINLDCIVQMYKCAALLLYPDEYEDLLQEIFYFLSTLLTNLDCTLEELTELNYQKLNSEETNHGWANAR